jgi:hypothetical protein
MANLLGQWKGSVASGLAASDEQRSLRPLEVIQFERSDLTRSQTQARQQKQHGSVAKTRSGLWTAHR